MAHKVRVAVIGCGMISKRLHVPDLATCDEAEIVALCDVREANARELAERWVPGAKVFTDYKALLRETRPEAAVVTVPNVFHAPVTIDALKAGCHVMVEKPMAAGLEEGRRMVEAARRAKKLLLVNQSQRLFPVHRKAKEVMDSGILGKVLVVHGMFGHEGPEHWSPEGKWFFRKNEARFGAMADLGVHKADIIRFLTGKEVVRVSAYSARLEKKHTDVEDNFVSCLMFEDGTLGTLAASWTTKGVHADYAVFHCANGTLRVNEIPGRPLVANLKKPECEITFDLPPGTYKYEGSWGIDSGGHFIRAVLGLEPPFCTGEDSLKSLQIILAAEESAKTGKSVTLSSGKRSRHG